MTEQELIEKIATWLNWHFTIWTSYWDWENLDVATKKQYKRLATRILTIIEKAGYVELKKGYVKLAEDQGLPRNPHLGIPAYFEEYKNCQQDMLKEGWRKVLPEEDKEKAVPDCPGGKDIEEKIPEEQLPTPAELRGMVTDFTGGKESGEYVRSLRGQNESPIPDGGHSFPTWLNEG